MVFNPNGKNSCDSCENWGKPITKENRDTMHTSVQFRCDSPDENGREVCWCPILEYPMIRKDGCDLREHSTIFAEIETGMRKKTPPRQAPPGRNSDSGGGVTGVSD